MEEMYAEWAAVMTRQGGISLLVALVLGGMVGIQREISGHEAGFRTNTLVCVGSALAMLVSIHMHEFYGGDAGRIAAQVISGIGFLGAGTIIRTGLTVRGLTTAAGLWVMACVGLAAGAGMYAVAFVGTICCLIVMAVMGWMEARAVSGRRGSVCSVLLEIENRPETLSELESKLDQLDRAARIEEVKYLEDDYVEVNILVHTNEKKHGSDVVQMLSQLKGVRQLTMMF